MPITKARSARNPSGSESATRITFAPGGGGIPYPGLEFFYYRTGCLYDRNAVLLSNAICFRRLAMGSYQNLAVSELPEFLMCYGDETEGGETLHLHVVMHYWTQGKYFFSPGKRFLGYLNCVLHTEAETRPVICLNYHSALFL